MPELMEETLQPSPAAVTAAPTPRPVRSVSLKTRLINLAAVVIPFLALIAAIFLLWGVAFSWIYLGLLMGMYAVTAIGITVGFHRLFTHRSFDTPRPIAFVLAALGSMAVEGPVLEWVAVHRRHHQHSDSMEDPHSPHTKGAGIWGALRGVWHAHVGWMFNRRPGDLARYVGDLRKDPMMRSASRLFPIWVLAGLVIPATLGGLLTLSWTGVLLGLIWGGLVRIFLVHHVTWSINSVCHIWGTRPFECHDESRNNPIFGVLGLGEGWHNNHHAFPNSARHGLRWWELDASYLFIRGLALVGLARNIRLPAPERVVAKRRA
jgi:stearoyl-CoA desaturase (delta-9 desaturase)